MIPVTSDLSARTILASVSEAIDAAQTHNVFVLDIVDVDFGVGVGIIQPACYTTLLLFIIQLSLGPPALLIHY